VLARHWPNVLRHDDVKTFLTGDSLDAVAALLPIDAVVGGFPCQPVSVAGSRKGDADARWLWPEMFRIVGVLRPRWVVAENVPGLRTLGADAVLEDLERAGYTAWPLVVGADDVGAPHRRKRVFIVAHRTGGGLGVLGRSREEDRHADGEGAVNVADGDGRRRERGGEQEPRGIEGTRGHVADGCGAGWTATAWPAGPDSAQHGWEPPRLLDVADPSVGVGGRRDEGAGRGRGGAVDAAAVVREGLAREAEPRLGLVPDGLPVGLAARDRRARLKALGNAVVPQVAEAIGRAINAAERSVVEAS
jgi:DNA (cytosine-5)-methyltransferase 1